jgi:hypothetical protein
VLKTYGAAPYGAAIKKLEKQIKEKQQSVDEKIGVKVCPARASHDGQAPLTITRNQIPDSPLRISGILPPTANACPRSSHTKWRDVRRL